MDVRDHQLQALDRARRASTMPVPSAIEQADPGGVSWTNRSSSVTVWSWSAVKPALSV
jgi:hypothetical protein